MVGSLICLLRHDLELPFSGEAETDAVQLLQRRRFGLGAKTANLERASSRRMRMLQPVAAADAALIWKLAEDLIALVWHESRKVAAKVEIASLLAAIDWLQLSLIE